MDKDKRYFREQKRVLKQKGGKRRRQHLKRALADQPEEAAFHTGEFDFGRCSSADYNGMDKDATRRRSPEEE